MTETQLVARVVAGDPAAERGLYDLHVDRVYRLAHRLAGDGELARDLTQETFIRAFDRIATFRGEAAFATWLRVIALSVISNGIRARKPAWRHETGYEEVLAADWAADPRREAEPDLRERLRAAIDALPDGYRTVFVMHDVEGYTHEEIGAALGVQPGTSKAQLSRARARLRERLADFAREWTA